MIDQTRDLDALIDRTHQSIREAFERQSLWVSSDGLERVGERDIETAFGWHEGRLADARRSGTGPRPYFGGGGHRVTYRLRDVASWVEAESEKMLGKSGELG
jgi:hypothetical protein